VFEVYLTVKVVLGLSAEIVKWKKTFDFPWSLILTILFVSVILVYDMS